MHKVELLVQHEATGKGIGGIMESDSIVQSNNLSMVYIYKRLIIAAAYS
jgi:hypothetical protein